MTLHGGVAKVAWGPRRLHCCVAFSIWRVIPGPQHAHRQSSFYQISGADSAASSVYSLYIMADQMQAQITPMYDQESPIKMPNLQKLYEYSLHCTLVTRGADLPCL